MAFRKARADASTTSVDKPGPDTRTPSASARVRTVTLPPPAEILAATGAACVEKPFDLERLEALVRETAGRATAGSRAAR